MVLVDTNVLLDVLQERNLTRLTVAVATLFFLNTVLLFRLLD